MKGFKHGTRKKIYKCHWCGEEFQAYLSRNPKFCSKDHMKQSGVFTHKVLHTQETKDRIAEKKRLNPTGFKKGKDNFMFKKHPWNYQGGIRTMSQIIKDDARYAKWRFSVFKRDDFTCRQCGNEKGGNIQAHHIKSKVSFPELAFDINNGLTLCVPCHKKTDNYGGKAIIKKIK